ncbi:RING/FYVE/PHD zinc finger superfamily protein [Euphorbia peplus]|nr:RING/FYVE/PHD zinc finger superfamily protein [Euphorbia peplus]
MEEDNITLQSLPPLKRLRLLQQRHLHDNKENFNPSFQLPSKKRKESRHPPSHCSFFPLPAKKRVSALHPDFFLDLNIEYKGDPDVLSECPPNPFVEIPHLEGRGVKSESSISIVPNPFVEIPHLVKQDEGSESESQPEPPVLTATDPQISEEKETPVEEEDDEDEDGIVCAICQSTDGDPKDPIVFCDGCDLMVHTTCYGNPLIKGVPDGDWFCAQCLVSKPDKALSCCLCPTKSGAMKPTTDGLWAHIVCSVYVPEVFFEDPDGREGINCCKIPKRRWQDKCYICKTRKGCAIRCSEPMCPLAFHVTCGLNQDLCIEYKQGKEIIVAGFCRTHSDLWKKQQETGKFKIVASKEHTK